MIYRNLELHNIAEVQPVADGVRFQRVPEVVRRQLNDGAQARVRQPDNCEIRFVTEADSIDLTLSSEGETDVTFFHGMFDARTRHTIGRNPTTISISMNERLRKLDKSWWQDQPFAPQVHRIVFGGRRRDPVILHDISGGTVRPPQADEKPGLTYLAYGTSITHGFDCSGPHLSYVAQTAWQLGADLINLGVAGSCFCEHAFADHIAQRSDWDIASLALSVNMQHFSMDEFRERVEYMVGTVAGGDTSRPVACITLYPYLRDFGIEPAAEHGGTPDEYRQALRDIVAQCPHPNVHLIEGPEVLTNLGGLTADLVHPSDLGMIEMGRNLASWLKPLLASDAGKK